MIFRRRDNRDNKEFRNTFATRKITMANFLFWSDLHDEFWNALPEPEIPDNLDAVLIAGDLSNKGRHVDCALMIWDRFRVPVVIVRGNHEFYHGHLDEVVRQDRTRIDEMNALGADIRLLDGEATEINGTRVIGASLWTDLRLYPAEEVGARRAVQRGMNDFKMIRSGETGQMSLDDWDRMHRRDRSAVLDLLDAPYAGDTVVMTHHLPLKELIHPSREIGQGPARLMNAAFASDMWNDIKGRNFSTWLCGHSHDGRDITMSGENRDVRFVTNPRGYPGEDAPFDPGMIVRTGKYPAPDFLA